MSKKDIRDEYGHKIGELKERGRLLGGGYDIHNEYGGKVGELKERGKLLGGGYDVRDQYGGKVGELRPSFDWNSLGPLAWIVVIVFFGVFLVAFWLRSSLKIISP